MKAKIVGIRKSQYEKDGVSKASVNIYCTKIQKADDSLEGQETCQFFMSQKDFDSFSYQPSVGESVIIDTDVVAGKFVRVCDIEQYQF